MGYIEYSIENEFGEVTVSIGKDEVHICQANDCIFLNASTAMTVADALIQLANDYDKTPKESKRTSSEEFPSEGTF